MVQDISEEYEDLFIVMKNEWSGRDTLHDLLARQRQFSVILLIHESIYRVTLSKDRDFGGFVPWH